VPRKRSTETVAYVVDGEKVLLGKKLIRQGKGLWNGFGGGVKSCETVQTAAVRELIEETRGKNSEGIIPLSIYQCGVIQKYEGRKKKVKLHFFMVTAFEGKASETDEMKPHKFNINKLPLNKMWPGDELLVPLFLQGKKVIGNIYCDKKGNIVCKDLEIVDEIPRIINF